MGKYYFNTGSSEGDIKFSLRNRLDMGQGHCSQKCYHRNMFMPKGSEESSKEWNRRNLF